jgi:adenylate cyclase
VLLILVTSGIIVFYADHAHRDTALALSAQSMTELSGRVIERTTGFLAPARAVADLEAKRLASGVDLDHLEPEMVDLLETAPQIESTYAANPLGRMVQVRRAADRPVLEHRWIVSGPAGTEEIVRGDAGRSTSTRVNYDPTTRAWWKAATATDGPAWTEAYIFFTRKQPGLTAARAVHGPDGSLLGVTAADVMLGDISQFLASLPLGDSGRALVVGPDGTVVAAPDPAMMRDSNGELILPALAGCGPPWDAPEVAIAVAHAAPATFQVRVGKRSWLVGFQPFPADLGTGWGVVTALPTAELMGRADESRLRAIGLALLTMLGALAAGLVLAGQIAGPIDYLGTQIARVTRLEHGDFTTGSWIREVQSMSTSLAGMQAGLDSFRRYVPTRLVRELLASAEPARLGGEERSVSIIFCDLRGYSTFVEVLPPARVVHILNDFFGEMQRIAEAHGAGVVDYAGDAVILVFGAPGDLPGHPEAAVRCALAMREGLAALNAGWEASGLAAAWKEVGIERLACRIGVHTGPVVAGNLGSTSHLKYSVVGDTVNVAARLEQLNKELGTDLLVSAEVYEAIGPELRARAEARGSVLLKGRSRPQQVYGVS